MAKAKLASKAEVLAYLSYAQLGITQEDLADVLLKMIRVETRTWIERSQAMKYNQAIEDLDDFVEYGYIWCASLCFSLEKLSMMGIVEQSSGDVQTAKTGDVTTTFQRWQPMFFFAKGMAQGFYELLPHLTYQMMAMQMIRSWRLWVFDKTHPNEVPFGTIVGTINPENNLFEITMGTPIDFALG